MLTVLTRGFRELLLSRDEDVENRVVRTLVPVSVRTPGETRHLQQPRLGDVRRAARSGSTDPVERLGAIPAQMEGLKESKQAVAGEALTSLTGFAPSLLLALADAGRDAGSRSGAEHRDHECSRARSGRCSWPGARCSRRSPSCHSAGHVRVGVAIFSYDGALNFGVTGDYENAPDIRVLCDGIEDGMSELLAAAQPAGPTRPRSRQRAEHAAPAP